MSVHDDAKQEGELEELRQVARRAQREAADARRRKADLVDAVYQAARDAAVVIGKPEAVPRPPRDRRRSPLHALLHLTDWQLGKESATYTSDVCAARVREAVDRAVHLTNMERADHPVRACHLMLGGDLVEGVQVFPGQAFEVDQSVYGQLFQASGLIESTILALLEEFETVDVWWVPGNHGRLGRRGDYPRLDNVDVFACRIAQERTSHLPRLTWHDPHAGWYQVVEAGSYRALLVHGDQMPRTVPAILRKAHQWAAGVMPEFHDLFYGHVHSEMTLPMADGRCVFVTPSTESSNEYAREVVAAQGRPAQRLHFVDPAKGRRASERLLWLGE